MFPAEAVVKWHMRRLRKVLNFHSPPLWSDRNTKELVGGVAAPVQTDISVNACFKGGEVPVSALEEMISDK